MGYLKPLTTGAAALVFLVGNATGAGAQDLSVRSDETADVADTGSGDPVIAVGSRDDAGGRIVGRLDLESSHHGGPDDLRAGPWCNNQCITSGVAYLHGDGVRLVVETSVTTDLYWYGWEESDPGNSLGQYWTGDATSHEWVIPDLEPGATYFVQVHAADEFGNSSAAWGTFTMPA